MLARRVIAVSPDKQLGKLISTALKAAGGAVDTHHALDSLGKADVQAALVVLHLDGALSSAGAELLPRMTGDGRAIAILPRSNLAAVVDVMQSSERMAGLIIAEELDPRVLSAMATRVLAGDIFGLEKLVPWGTLVHSQLVGDYQEKSLCISQISEFAELMGVRRKYREAIEQCIDEMLMNALYDAPVDEQGKQIFSDIPTKTRISLRVEQKVVVQYSCDGRQFAVSVRDAFGTLERATVLRYLHKCLHAEQQIDRKVGGAGLGLYLIVNSATTVFFNVLPGVATEAVCVFDLEAPKLQLEQFGFFSEKIDAAGRLASGPSRRLPAGVSHVVERRRSPQPPPPPRALVAALSVAIAAVLAMIGIAAWPRLFGSAHGTAQVTFTTVPKGATIELEGRNVGTTASPLVVGDLEAGRAYAVVARLDGYEPRHEVVQPRDQPSAVTFELAALAATVDLDSQPSGATVLIEGQSAGTTPMTLSALAPGKSISVTFRKTGYHDVTGILEVPGPGKQLRFVQPLAVADELARIALESDPPGAQVIQNGQLLAGVTTPAQILVEAGKLQRFVLAMPHHVSAVIEPFTPARGADSLVRSGKLPAGTTVRIESNLGATVSVAPAPACQALATPAECVVVPGAYTVELAGTAGAIKLQAKHALAIGASDTIDRFELGFIEAGPGKQLEVAGATARKIAVEAGTRSVSVVDDSGRHPATVQVKPGATVIAN